MAALLCVQWLHPASFQMFQMYGYTLLGHDLFLTWIKQAFSGKEIIFVYVLGLNSNKINHFL